MLTPSQQARNELAALKRGGRPDHDAEVRAARLALRESLVMAAIRKHVETAPPFTAEQRLRIAAVLCSPGGGTDAS